MERRQGRTGREQVTDAPTTGPLRLSGRFVRAQPLTPWPLCRSSKCSSSASNSKLSNKLNSRPNIKEASPECVHPTRVPCASTDPSPHSPTACATLSQSKASQCHKIGQARTAVFSSNARKCRQTGHPLPRPRARHCRCRRRTASRPSTRTGTGTGTGAGSHRTSRPSRLSSSPSIAHSSCTRRRKRASMLPLLSRPRRTSKGESSNETRKAKLLNHCCGEPVPAVRVRARVCRFERERPPGAASRMFLHN